MKHPASRSQRNAVHACAAGLLAAVIAWLPAAPIARAAEIVSAGEKFKQILSRQDVHLDSKISENPTFCGTFLNDLKAKRNIEFVEPLFRTNDANDPRLKAYHGCGEYWSRGKHGKIPENSYSFLDELGTRSFALYRIDLDNNPANGIEELLYAETDPDNPTSTPIGRVFPGYDRVDLKRCLRIEGITAHQVYQGRGIEHDNVSAIVRYRNRHYVLDLARSGAGVDANFVLTIWNFKSNIRRKADTIPCFWSTMKK